MAEETLKQSMQFVTPDGSGITYHVGTKATDMDPAAVAQARQLGHFDHSDAPAVFGGYVVEESAGAPLPRPDNQHPGDPKTVPQEDIPAAQALNPSKPSPHPPGQHPEDTGENVTAEDEADRDIYRSANAATPPARGPAMPDEPEDTKKSTSKLGEKPAAGHGESAKTTVGSAKKK